MTQTEQPICTKFQGYLFWTFHSISLKENHNVFSVKNNFPKGRLWAGWETIYISVVRVDVIIDNCPNNGHGKYSRIIDFQQKLILIRPLLTLTAPGIAHSVVTERSHPSFIIDTVWMFFSNPYLDNCPADTPPFYTEIPPITYIHLRSRWQYSVLGCENMCKIYDSVENGVLKYEWYHQSIAVSVAWYTVSPTYKYIFIVNTDAAFNPRTHFPGTLL